MRKKLSSKHADFTEAHVQAQLRRSTPAQTAPDLNPELRNRLEQLATECRHLLELARPHMRSVPTLYDFPNGSCSDASHVLAWYLREHGVTEGITYARSDKRSSHAWLEVEGWLVDITADQQSWGNPPVWILPATQSPFHQKHEPAERRNANLETQDSRTQSWVRQAIACLRKAQAKL